MNSRIKSLHSDPKCRVVSKYFENTTAMDDSLLNFQQKKKLNLPNKAQGSNSNTKAKSRKILKKNTGQKDIRDVIKGKYNDLTAYTKKFGKDYKSIDIESEQLQLAIGLSRSLQKNLPDENKDSDDFTFNFISQASKIRSTLLEYGFTVPKKNTAKRILRKRKKNYKLLSLTDEERKQIITDRYSQVLFQNLDSSVTSIKTAQKDLSNVPSYFVGTSIPYNDIKNDHIYFIEGLIEKSMSTVGCLLKDWSKIPGRPKSPCREIFCVNFKNIECPQDKLDNILTGSLLSAKEIIKSCQLKENEGLDSFVSNSIETVKIELNNSQDSPKNNTLRVNNMDQNNSEAMQSQQYRCISPDMFSDDEVISIIESPEKITQSNVICRSFIDTECMNLTECVNTNFVDDKFITSDHMELTDCCGTKSQSIIVDVENKINLTPNCCLHEEVTSPQSFSIGHSNKNNCIGDVDLTQSSDEETLPFVQISGSNKKKPDINNVNCSSSNQNNEGKDSENKCNEADSTEKVDLTQEHETTIEQENHSSEISVEYVYVHSDNSESLNENSDILSGNYNNESNDKCDIDLTQSSNEEILIQENHDTENVGDKCDISIDYDLNLKQSYLEDENISNRLSDKALKSPNIETINDCSNKSGTTNLKSNSEDISSQNSVVFEISDSELNYSIQKSKQDIFNYSVESVLNDLSNDQNCKKYSESDNCFKGNDSYLPQVKVKSKTSPFKPKNDEIQLKSSNSTVDTPLRRILTNTNAETPTSSEFIIKTDHVTPLQDYASMTTPDRNKELNKYGLKPLKRKRAIQLLTHIYNQTHPIVEECFDLPSPSKKRKSNEFYSPNASRSPKKFRENGGSQCINNGEVKENDLYEVTSENPLIRDVDCAPEDWVFQRKEKAKLCSCRVPLHIAFHNYVSCRQKLRESILRYVPINIDLVHKQLAASGHKYDPKDLLRFLDKRCITVKTTDNDARNRNGKK